MGFNSGFKGLTTVLSTVAVTGYPVGCRFTDTAAVFGVAIK